MKKVDGMVLVPFRHASFLKEFRWNDLWWTKTSFKSGTFKKGGIESFDCEIDSERLVGVFLNELTETAKTKIVK